MNNPHRAGEQQHVCVCVTRGWETGCSSVLRSCRHTHYPRALRSYMHEPRAEAAPAPASATLLAPPVCFGQFLAVPMLWRVMSGTEGLSDGCAGALQTRVLLRTIYTCARAHTYTHTHSHTHRHKHFTATIALESAGPSTTAGVLVRVYSVWLGACAHACVRV